MLQGVANVQKLPALRLALLNGGETSARCAE